ncbi:hypothetical protein XENTR_v10009242 [Xenopus tropicalis]|nr:hypothetical protein XENTR_v10009242 [Xenopus tropicalis]
MLLGGTIASWVAFHRIDASFLLQVHLWCGHRREAITNILSYSSHNQKSACNLEACWRSPAHMEAAGHRAESESHSEDTHLV